MKAILLLCMLMQGVMLYPHHHHPDSETPCLVLSHCLDPHGPCRHDAGSTAEDNDCTGHSHECPSGVCGPERDIAAGLRIDRAHDAQQFSPVWFGYWFAAASEIAHLAQADTESARILDKERPFVEPPYLVYVTRASLLRAPTRLV